MTKIPYGLRRFPLYAAMFGGLGVGLLVWSERIVKPTFVFPFGTLEPEAASIVVAVVGVLALFHLVVTSYVRFVRRPAVVLRRHSVSLPVGEFGFEKVVLRAGDVLTMAEERRRGFRSCHVKHRMGQLWVHSSKLPHDDAFHDVCRALQRLEVDHGD